MAQAEFHNGPRLIDELVPGIGAVIDDVFVAAEDTVGQPVVPHELPDVFLRIEFWAFGGKRDDGDVAGNDQIGRQMPPGLVEQECCMSTRLDLGGDGFQMKVHCLRVAPGQDQSDSLASLGTDCAKDVSGSGPLILRCRRARAPAAPAASDLVLLSDPRFVAEPDIYSVWVEPETVRNRVQDGWKLFLNSSMAPAACA